MNMNEFVYGVEEVANKELLKQFAQDLLAQRWERDLALAGRCDYTANSSEKPSLVDRIPHLTEAQLGSLLMGLTNKLVGNTRVAEKLTADFKTLFSEEQGQGFVERMQRDDARPEIYQNNNADAFRTLLADPSMRKYLVAQLVYQWAVFAGGVDHLGAKLAEIEDAAKQSPVESRLTPEKLAVLDRRDNAQRPVSLPAVTAAFIPPVAQPQPTPEVIGSSSPNSEVGYKTQEELIRQLQEIGLPGGGRESKIMVSGHEAKVIFHNQSMVNFSIEYRSQQDGKPSISQTFDGQFKLEGIPKIVERSVDNFQGRLKAHPNLPQQPEVYLQAILDALKAE